MNNFKKLDTLVHFLYINKKLDTHVQIRYSVIYIYINKKI